jgi:hypothetical protein
VPDDEAIIANRRDKKAVREMAKPVMPEREPVMPEREVVPDGEAGTRTERCDRGTAESTHPSVETMHPHPAMHAHSTAHARRQRAREHRQAQRSGRDQRYDRFAPHVLLLGYGCTSVTGLESRIPVARSSAPIVISDRLVDADDRVNTNSHAAFVALE